MRKASVMLLQRILTRGYSKVVLCNRRRLTIGDGSEDAIFLLLA
jgi:hypothetical protein